MIGSFASLHPFVCFLYFFIAMVFSMIFKHPIYLMTQLFMWIVFCGLLDGGERLKKSLKGYLLMATFVFIMNPLFSSRGATLLFYFRDRPVTLESTVFGLLFALSLLTFLIIFIAYNQVITPDKFLYLTASLIPKTAFSILVTMRFVPLFQRRMSEIASVQRSQGKLLSSQSKKQHLKDSMETLNTLVSWSLEAALQTAASMRSRGYGCGKRTSVVRYRMTNRDWGMLLCIGITSVTAIYGRFFGYGMIEIYPQIQGMAMNLWACLHFCAFFLFTAIPILLDGKERVQWHFIRLKI